MMSSAQLASCLQLPVSLDPLLGISQQPAPTGQLWLQDNTQPTAVPLPQHPVEGGMWGLSPEGLQQPTTLFSASDLLEFSTVPVLQDSSLVSLPMPETVSAGLNNMTMFQQQLPDAHLQQVYLTASGELVMGGNQLTLQQQQLAGCADSSAAAGSDSILHQQLQQLQEAVQRLTSETVMLKSQVSQAQGQPVSFTTEAALTTSSSPCASDMELPYVTAPLAASLISSSSPASSFCGLDSMSNSSWQCTDTISGSTNSSPSFALQHKSRLGSGPLVSATPVTASPAHGSSMLRIVSGPEPPQPNLGMLMVPQMLQGAPAGPNMGMAGGLTSGLAGLAPSSGLVMLKNNNNWSPVSGLAHGLLAASAGTSQPQPFAAGPVGLQQGTLLHGCYTMADQQPLHSLQVGRFSAGGAFAQPQARRFKGNSCAFAPKNRPVGSAGARGNSAPAAAKPAQGADAGATGKAAGAAPTVKGPSSGPWAQVSLEDGLRQLWSGEQLLRSQGGRLFNVQQLAWHPVGEPDPSSQDMYNFQKLKRMVQKLDAVHKTRVKLIKRIHAVADHGDKDLKSVYREVRGLIGEMLHDSAMQIKSMEECRVTGLVRLALMLQEALELGPKDSAATAPVLGPVREAQKVQDEVCTEAAVAVCAGSAEVAAFSSPV